MNGDCCVFKFLWRRVEGKKLAFSAILFPLVSVGAFGENNNIFK